jgi:hypothetical protein
MAYWRNTIFYDAGKAPAVLALLEGHFKRQEIFVKTKWIMLMGMEDAPA